MISTVHSAEDSKWSSKESWCQILITLRLQWLVKGISFLLVTSFAKRFTFSLSAFYCFGDHLELAKYIPIKNIKILYNLYIYEHFFIETIIFWFSSQLSSSRCTKRRGPPVSVVKASPFCWYAKMTSSTVESQQLEVWKMIFSLWIGWFSGEPC